MTNEILLPGVGNARELGGYTINDRTVKKGLLLRTAALTNAASEATERLQNEYRVQTVVDFRMNAERMISPCPEIPEAQNIHLSVIEMTDDPDTDPKILEEFAKGGDRMKLFELSYASGALNPDLYVRFLLGERGKKAYRTFFELLLAADARRAVLWHCTDGKDRTGCAAMLLLGALGADRDTIIDDYMLTNEYNARVIEGVRQKVKGYPMPQEKLDALLFMCGGVNERYITTAMDTLEKQYGSIAGYLRDELGVDDAATALLREKYLERS